MATRDDTTKRRSRRVRIKRGTPSASQSPPDPLKQAIDAERAQLMQAQAVVKTLSAALMNAEDKDAMFYVDAANVAAKLIDAAVGVLDSIGMGKGVKEMEAEYLCFDSSIEDAPILAFPRGPGEGTLERRH